jgi:hypothetical protein
MNKCSELCLWKENRGNNNGALSFESHPLKMKKPLTKNNKCKKTEVLLKPLLPYSF